MIYAAVCHEFNAPLKIEPVSLDTTHHGEICVKVSACAICHSDIHIMDGDFDDGVLPLVAGHEAAGIVMEVGAGVSGFKVGDRVVTSLLRSCGQCHYCLKGERHLCEGKLPTDGLHRLWTEDGTPIQRGANMAAFAEEILVHQSQAVLVPDAVSLESASLLGCGVITGTGCVFNTASIQPGQSVAVIGCGGVGLNAIQAARIADADPIIAIDLVDEKLKAAEHFGAHYAIHSNEQSLEFIQNITDMKGVDYAFITVGSVKAGEFALKLLGKRGTAVFVGLPGMQQINVSVYHLVLGEQHIIGSVMGSTQLHRDVSKLFEFYEQGNLKLEDLITRRYPLNEINEAIADVKQGHALRNIVIF